MHPRIKRGLLVAALPLITLGLTVAPAAASVPPETGAGVTTSGGFNNYTQVDLSPLAPLPLCIGNSTDAVLTLNSTGTFSAGPGNVFVGATTTTVTIAARALFFNPAGTFTSNMTAGPCTVPAFGPVTGEPATVVVKDASTGTVICHNGTGTYGRVGENGLVTVQNPSCTVNGVTTTPSLLQFSGSEQPCFPGGPPPVDPCASPSTEWAGTYTQN